MPIAAAPRNAILAAALLAAALTTAACGRRGDPVAPTAARAAGEEELGSASDDARPRRTRRDRPFALDPLL